MRELLDLELADALSPTAAPPELWERIQVLPLPKRHRAVRTTWPIAAIVTIAIAAGTLWVRTAPGRRPALPIHEPQYPDTTCQLCHTS
jgi:hypothetical protein